jgi:formylglycine-generating enzyme required for sulfatase activity
MGMMIRRLPIRINRVVFGVSLILLAVFIQARFFPGVQATTMFTPVTYAGNFTDALSVPLSEEAFVPAGVFLMGCSSDTAGDKLCALDAQPIHAVYLDAYMIDKTEVSNAQYAECVAAGACLPPLSVSSATRAYYYGNPVYAHYPVVQMDWGRANVYCQWVGKRLPTEAEWEKAARGNDLRPFPWGFDDLTCEKCNGSILYLNIYGEPREDRCVGDTVSVESYLDYASPYGALNMVGNAQEWVNDIYLRLYYSQSPYFNPQGPASTDSNEHLIRGGSWKGTLTHANTWVRLDESDIYHEEMNGFRCARTVSGGNPTPTPTPSPTPTPIPVGSAQINAEGGIAWLAYPGHLTVARIPGNVVSAQTSVTLTYVQQLDTQGIYQGLNHFFSVSTTTGDPSPGAHTNPFPLELILGYQSRGSIISDTLHLYRFDAGSWVTDGLTITERLGNSLGVVIDRPGIFGLLGETKRTYLPYVARRN